jgi:hypothetical protein
MVTQTVSNVYWFRNTAPAQSFFNLAYDRAGNKLYGVCRERCGVDNVYVDNVFLIDLPSGDTSVKLNNTLLGPLGVSFESRGGLGTHGSALYMAGQVTGVWGLYSVSTTTGAATLIGPTGGIVVRDLAWDESVGKMLATNGSNIYSANLDTGALTLVLTQSAISNIRGLGDVAGVVPEPGTLTLTTVGLLGLIWCARRRRSRERSGEKPATSDGAPCRTC